MNAGKELDALVGKKIMGTPQVEVSFVSDADPNTGVLTTSTRLSHLPYSTDIASAWEVAQKVIDLDSDHKFVIHLSPSQNEECEVEMTYWDNTDPNDPVLVGPTYILGKTAPHVICLAALKALGIEVS